MVALGPATGLCLTLIHLFFTCVVSAPQSMEICWNGLRRSQLGFGGTRSVRSVHHLHPPSWMRRHTLRRGRWRRTHLTYSVSKYPRMMDTDVTDSELGRAFGLWSASSLLTFQRVVPGGPPADIDVRFETGSHQGCERPFDGPNGILAHAYYPKYGGDVHFDDEEYWTVNKTDGVSLMQVATHAIGHALGLRHSYNTGSVMFPEYSGYNPHFRLQPDDIRSIQALYRHKTSATHK